MATMGNYASKKIDDLRKAFFDSKTEREFFLKLMENPTERERHEELKTWPGEKLYKEAMKIIGGFEEGKYNDEEAEKAEYKLVHYLGALVALQRVAIRGVVPGENGPKDKVIEPGKRR